MRRRRCVRPSAIVLEATHLDEEVPDLARLVDVDLDEPPGLAPSEVTVSASVLANEGFLDEEIRFREDAERRAELLFGCGEEMEGSGRGEIERGSWG